jgi:hypothetical protein
VRGKLRGKIGINGCECRDFDLVERLVPDDQRLREWLSWSRLELVVSSRSASHSRGNVVAA